MATVLVVDDQALNRELITTLLRYAGHHPIEAADGVEALVSARAERPELVICDILMPTMDGYEFVRQLRADPEIAQTEVIFYTATFHEHEARGLARACGVSRVLTKPCEPQEILSVVEQVLAHRSPSESLADTDHFDREHLRLLTDKLLAKVNELESANQHLARLHRVATVLSDVNSLIVRVRERDELFREACRIAVQVGASAGPGSG